MQLHASAIALNATTGMLITGASGSGKSSLCSELIALHSAQLIGDDRINLTASQGLLVASGAPELNGLIELYGMGIVRLPDALCCASAQLAFEVRLTAASCPTERLPAPQHACYLEISLPVFEIPACAPSLAAKIALLAQVFQQFGSAGLVDVAKPRAKD